MVHMSNSQARPSQGQAKKKNMSNSQARLVREQPGQEKNKRELLATLNVKLELGHLKTLTRSKRLDCAEFLGSKQETALRNQLRIGHVENTSVLKFKIVENIDVLRSEIQNCSKNIDMSEIQGNPNLY